jgi:anaerobic selenocysteine-containing dehydrogenase
MAESDCIVFMGSNMAENHPVAFRWPMKAKLKGAKLIHVDPRFTRTSAVCDIYAPLRAGSDIAFLGGLIHFVLESKRFNDEPFSVNSYSTTQTRRFSSVKSFATPKISKAFFPVSWSIKAASMSGPLMALSANTTVAPGSTRTRG